MRLAARRFRDIITRRRELPGRYNEYGEWVPGASSDETLRASIQPMSLTDSDFAGGVMLVHRIKAFVLPRRELIGTPRATLLWNGDPLEWSGQAITWGLGATVRDVHAVAASFDHASADRVIYAGEIYVVEQSASWPAYTRAVLLRES